jgi:hypothetical protein
LFALLKGVEIDSGQLGAMKENFVSVIGADETKSAIRDDFLDSASSHCTVLRRYMLTTVAHPALSSRPLECPASATELVTPAKGAPHTFCYVPVVIRA